jgi:hypothetical protein
VFAPVAASLCAGAALEDLGDPIDLNSLTPGILPVAREEDGDLISEVMWVDHFGNCQLNLDPDDIDGWGDVVRARIADEWRIVRRSYAYSDIGDGEIGMVIDSYGLLGLRTGSEVRFQRLDGDEAPRGVDTPVEMGRRGGAQ